MLKRPFPSSSMLVHGVFLGIAALVNSNCLLNTGPTWDLLRQ